MRRTRQGQHVWWAAICVVGVALTGSAGAATTLTYQSYGNGDHFDFSTGQIVADDAVADFTLITNEGTNIGNEGTAIPGPMLLLLAVGSLDDVTSSQDVPAFTGLAPWITNSWEGDGTDGQPLSVGQVWAVHTREGNIGVLEILGVTPFPATSLTFDWKYLANAPPELAAIGDQTVTAGNTVALVLSATDADGDALSFSVSGNPVGSSLAGGIYFTWSPTAVQVGDHVVTFTADDGNGGTDSEAITITVVAAERIVFSSDRDGNGEIYVMEADGTNPVNLSDNPAFDGASCWSPDGTKVAFITDRDGNMEIYVMDSDGANQTRLTTNSALDLEPRWSPDGTKIAFSTDRDGNQEIYVMDSDGTNQANLTNHTGFDQQICWSPDGSMIAFHSQRDGNGEIYVMAADGTNPVNLTNHSGLDQQPSWSPDGTQIAFSTDREGDLEIYVMGSDGTNLVNLTNGTANDQLPAWSPRGTRIAFSSTRDGNMEVYVMEADGTNPVNLTNNPAFDIETSWGPAAVPEFVVPLSPGFNLVSLGEASANDSIAALMAPIVGNLIRVIGFETNATNPNPPDVGGKLYNPSLQPFINTLELTDYRLAYWLVMSGADILVTRDVPAKIVSSAVTGDGELHPVYDFMAIHGQLRVDGESAPVGTLVEVVDGEGTLAGRFEVHHQGYYGFLPIYRDDASSPVDEGADMGEWLTIQVNGQPVAQRVQWTSFGDEVQLDLEATSQVSSSRPTEFALGPNYPNPFNPSTTITYQLARDQEVVLSIWNLAGQLVRQMVHAPQAAGHYSVTWDGRDAAGSLAANGIYLYQIRAGDYQSARKMVLMK